MSPGPEILKKFGKYFLLDLLAQGGMAEVYRARDVGGRLLAIKRIIPAFSQNPEFVSMFQGEIKTTSGLTHTAIVQVYDYGQEDSMQYIAMELVDGKSLRQFISRFTELKSKFPVEAAVYIIEQAAHALYYAHSFKDKISGKSLNIVHRDISPQNILISYDGAIKVIDFGIAKAVTNVEATRSGVIKGKPSYLSPEQISGEVLDGRSDIFALGVVLWELLASRKLFASDNDFGIIKQIENCNSTVKPPSLYNPDVPKELDSIVLKILQKNRDSRFSNAEEMQRALHRLLYQAYPDFNPADLAYYARDLFKDEIVADRKHLIAINERAEQLLKSPTPPSVAEADKTTTVTRPTGAPSQPVEQEKKPIESTSPSTFKERERSGSFREIKLTEEEKTMGSGLRLEGGNKNKLSEASMGAASQSANLAGAVSRAAPRTTSSTPRAASSEPRAKSKTKPVAIAATLAALAGAYLYLSEDLNVRKTASTANLKDLASIVLESNVKAATIVINEKQVASSFPTQLKELPSEQPLKLSVAANGYKRVTQTLNLKAGDNKRMLITLEREDSSTPVDGTTVSQRPTVTLRLDVQPPGSFTKIWVNGNPIDALSAVTSVPVDTNIELVVEREGFRTYKNTFHIESKQASGQTEWPLKVQLQAAKFGYLSIKTTPSAEAVLSIDGVEEKLTTPFSRKRLPVGIYAVRLVNNLLGMEKEINVNIREDQLTNLEERLTVR